MSVGADFSTFRFPRYSCALLALNLNSIILRYREEHTVAQTCGIQQLKAGYAAKLMHCSAWFVHFSPLTFARHHSKELPE